MIIDPILTFEFPLFPTHVKFSEDKFVKINAQQLYSGTHFTVRNKIANKIKGYYSGKILSRLKESQQILQATPRLWIDGEIHVPRNYGDVKMIKQVINWKKPAEDYQINWDLDNINYFYSKTFMDAMVKMVIPMGKEFLLKSGPLKDDNASIVKKCASLEYIEVDDFMQRKFVFHFYDYDKIKVAEKLAYDYLKALSL